MLKLIELSLDNWYSKVLIIVLSFATAVNTSVTSKEFCILPSTYLWQFWCLAEVIF